MLYQVTERQFLEYAVRLSRHLVQCTDLDTYKLLEVSFDHLRRQATTLDRLTTMRHLLADRRHTIERIKELHDIR